MTAVRNGEMEAGIPPQPGEKDCFDNYQRFSGRTITDGNHDFERDLTRLACDEANVILKAIRASGRNLTPAGYVSAFESFNNLATIHWSPVTFGPGKHDGASQQRTIQYHADCQCFKALGSFEPMFQP